jgi:hypothetical protein
MSPSLCVKGEQRDNVECRRLRYRNCPNTTDDAGNRDTDITTSVLLYCETYAKEILSFHIFCMVRQPPVDLLRLRDHIQTPHSVGLSGRVIGLSQEHLPDHTHLSQEGDIHASGRVESAVPASQQSKTNALRRIHTYHAVPLPCRSAKALDCVFPI